MAMQRSSSAQTRAAVEDVKMNPDHHFDAAADVETEKTGTGPGFAEIKPDTLLMVATLITTLTYQLGTNVPGGYWQDDAADGTHFAGEPVMRDKHRRRYWLFMAASWTGFGSSMVLTLALLTVAGMPLKSRFVRWPFVVSYSSLVLTFITSQAHTSLVMDLLIWFGVMVVLYVAIKRKHLQRFCAFVKSLPRRCCPCFFR